MANLNKADIELITKLFVYNGKVFNISDEEYFKYLKDKYNIDLNQEKYEYLSSSAAGRFTFYLLSESDEKASFLIADHIVYMALEVCKRTIESEPFLSNLENILPTIKKLNNK